MSQNEIIEIKKVFPDFTRSIGEAMWCIFTGNYPTGAYRNVYLPNGQLCQHTWRMWGQIIADARGHKKESYTTFWESRVLEAKAKSVEKKFKKAGWKFSEEPIHLDADEKLRDETFAFVIDDVQLSLAKKKEKQLAIANTVKKRGRPPKVK
jgi:hypothetical protein